MRRRGALLVAALVPALGGCVGFGLYRPAPPGAPEIVEVRMNEYEIDPWPRLVRAGRAVLEVANDGALAHGLAVVGPGIDIRTGELVGPGERQKVPVDLRVGEYRLYCPDGNHVARGMEARLVVTDSVSWFRR